jgi:hypothetical protein
MARESDQGSNALDAEQTGYMLEQLLDSNAEHNVDREWIEDLQNWPER